MEFRVLGPLEVAHAGHVLALGGAQQRTILALLVLHAPEPVSTERLIDGLWGERPPASAPHAVQVYISGIRKALRDAPGHTDAEPGDLAVISRGSSGYRLDVAAERVDARRFERLAALGRRALRAGSLEEAERLLDEALGLWRGPAFADFSFMDFAATEASRLEELRVQALEARLEGRLGLGDFGGVVGELEALVAAHPLREHARWLLMRSLYGAGRQAEALAVYRAGHRLLSEELGLEPGRELRELEQAILRQTDSLEPAATPRNSPPDRATRPAGQLPLPPRLEGLPPIGYVGRTEQHALVKECWDTARTGPRQVLLVSGEPGVGKTQFTVRAVRELHAAGAQVLFGHCSEELSAPYGPWIQALSPFVEYATEASLADYLERYGGELARLVPALARRMPQAPAPRQTDPETERYLLFSAVVGLLEQASIVAPVVLLLDDLHWADRSTLALFKHAVAETAGLPLLILGAYRDSQLSREHPLPAVLADLRREQRIERLPVPGLGEDEILSMLEAEAGRETGTAGRELATQITTETGGNPFFVGEILRHLSETGALTQVLNGRSRMMRGLDQLGLPQSVREVVSRRVDQLGDGARNALGCASVIGPSFDLELLARVVPGDEDDLIDLLDIAVEASLIHEHPERAGSFSFAHDLINHALYDVLGVTRRARLHHRVAEALEDLCSHHPRARIEELARHWIAASPGDPEKARAYSQQAGEQALEKLAPDEAVRWFAAALGLLTGASAEDVSERCELTIRLGEAQRQAEQPEFRATLLGAAVLAEESHDAERMARAALANSRGFASAFGVVDTERVAVLQRAVELDRLSNPARSARLLSLQAMELQFDPDYERRRALADEALALARTADDDRSLPYVLRDHFHATWAADTLVARRRTAMEMTQLAIDADDPLARIWALDRSVHAAAESGALVEAAEALASLRASTERLGQPGLRWHAAYYAAGLAQLRGDLEAAERLAEEALHIGQQAAEPDTAFIYFGQICMVKVEQGSAADAVAMLELGADQNPGVAAYEAALAAVMCDMGRERDAAPRLSSSADRGFDRIPRDQAYSTALALWAKTAADLGSRGAAAALYDLIVPWHDQIVWNGANGLGSAESYLGMLAATLGAHDRAGEHFAAASALHQREGINVWEARNLCYWANSLLTSGAGEAALAMAERAIILAREHGYGASVRRAEELLRLAAVA